MRAKTTKSATIALVLSALNGAAFSQDASFFAIFDGTDPTGVRDATSGDIQPVYMGAGTVPPEECVEGGGWFASTDPSMQNILVQCGSGERFTVEVSSPASEKPLREPGSDWPGPMGE